MDCLVWILCAYGCSQILVYGKIFEKPKERLLNYGLHCGIGIRWTITNFIHSALDCMMCCGTWVGFFLSTIYSPTATHIGCPAWLSWLLDGAFSSGGVWLLNVAANRLDTTE